MKVCVVSPAANERYGDKFSWIAEGFEQAGHDVSRAHDIATLRANDAGLVVFSHYNAGVNDSDLVEWATGTGKKVWDGSKYADPSRKQALWVQIWWDLMDRDPAKPLADQELVKSFLPLMRAMDLVCVKERSNIASYDALGIHAAYLDQGCPADMPKATYSDSPEWDVMVFGSCDRQQRMSDVRALLAAGLRVAWAGRPGKRQLPAGIQALPWTQPINLPGLVSRAACVLSVDFRHDMDGYCSDRVWLAAGMGACILHRKSCWTPDCNPVEYDSQEELVESARRLARDPVERRMTGEKSRRKTMAKHTYKHSAVSIVKMLTGAAVA